MRSSLQVERRLESVADRVRRITTKPEFCEPMPEPPFPDDAWKENIRLPQARGWKRYLYQGAGLFFVGLAWLGAFLPVLPTTPFLLLASFFFVRSSPGLQAWLNRSPLFGPFLRDWNEHHGVRPRVKALAVSMIVVVVGMSLMSSRLPMMGKWGLVSLALVGLTVVLRLKTIRSEAKAPASVGAIHGSVHGSAKESGENDSRG